jgi:choline-sulfatase
MISLPDRFKPARVGAHVSLVDLLPTFMDMAKPGEAFEPVDAIDGTSLVPLLDGSDDGADRTVVSEYSSEGVRAASRMVREGRWKYIYTYGLEVACVVSQLM